MCSATNAARALIRGASMRAAEQVITRVDCYGDQGATSRKPRLHTRVQGSSKDHSRIPKDPLNGSLAGSDLALDTSDNSRGAREKPYDWRGKGGREDSGRQKS